MLRERGVELDIEFARRVVGDVQQLDVLGGNTARQSSHSRENREELDGVLDFHIRCELKFSEGELRAGQYRLFAVLQKGRGAAIEIGLFIVQGEFDVAVEMPIRTHTPRRGLAGRG